MNATPHSFEQAVAALRLPRPLPRHFVRTLSLLGAICEGSDHFKGGCFNITAMGHMLFAAQGIASTPCLGEVASEAGPFDHAWLEIDGAIYDLPIHYPMPGHARQPIVIGGLNFDGKAPRSLYGVDPKSYGGGWDPSGERAQVEPRTLPQYLDYVNDDLGLPVWGLLRDLAEDLGVSTNRQALHETHESTRWIIRADVPVPEAMTKRWRRVHLTGRS